MSERTGVWARVSSRVAQFCRTAVPAVVGASVLAAVAVIADPYPPYWGGGTGPAVHYAPVAWPADGAFTAYTRVGTNIADRRDNDGSNGGTSPQSYVNVSSGCTDQVEPSVYYAYDAGNQVLFFRWRVQAPPHNYATGPNTGPYSSSSPWSSALWTVFMDTNGDGYRDFAVHLDGSSGSPAAGVDRLASIWSRSKSQSVDYLNDPAIHLLRHNPAAFVDGPAATDRLLNFHAGLSPNANWSNGTSETTWNYGTTRATLLSSGCGEYFIDYQIPLAMLNATSVGGPQVTPTTPMSLFFATANSLQNPIQKDAVVNGDFVADPTRPIPGGDTLTPAGGTIQQPTVTSIAATGCGTMTLTGNIFDTLNLDRTSTVASVAFQYYADSNADGVANDAGSAWTIAAAGTQSADPVSKWTASWNTTALTQGQYLLAVKATDTGGNVTWSQFATQAEVDAFTGLAANNFPNAIGVRSSTTVNACGAAAPSISKTVSPAFVTAGGTVTFTVSVANTSSSAITLNSITDAMPAGFSYIDTTGNTLGTLSGSPAAAATGSIQWSFSSAVIPASTTRTLTFRATASSTAGTYTNSVAAATSYGTLSSGATDVGVGSPTLTIGKSANVSSANPGDAVTYTITYANDSPVSVTNAVITDVLPAGLDFVGATGGGVYTAGTRTITWTIGSLASGSGARSVTVNATVTTPYPGGAAIPLVNTASITATETTGSSASAPLYVDAARAQLSIQKEGNTNLAAAGGSITYTLTYSNTGAASASGVTITDPIPTGWSFVSATGGGVNSGGTVTWNIGALAAAASGSVQLVLAASNPYTGARPAINTATLSATGLSSSADSFQVSIVQTGSVCSTYYFQNSTTSVGFDGIQRIANTTAVTAANTGSSTVNATSTGSSSTVELIRFYLDPAVSSQVNMSGNLSSSVYIDRENGPGVDVTGTVYDYDPATGTRTSLGAATTGFGGSTKGIFSFSIPVSGSLLAGHRLLWVYTFASANTQAVQLYAQFAGTATNPLSGGTTAALASSSFCATAPANPTLGTQVDKLVAAPGDTLTYTIKFGNGGGTNMTGAQIVDTLPDGVTFVSATLNGSAASAVTVSGQQRTYAVRSSDTATSGQVSAGQGGTLVITATVTAPFTGTSNTLTNTTSLTSAQTSAIVDAITTSLQRPSVTIAKSSDKTLLVPGDTVTYALTVLNSGPGTASNVTIGDALPATAYFTYVANSAKLNGVTITPDPVTAGVLSTDIGSLAAGSSATVSVSMLLASSGAPAGTTAISNTATVADAGTTGTRSSNALPVTITTNPNLTLTKASSPGSGPVAAGSTIVYTLTVTNAGSGDATGVSVTDVVPPSTAYIAGTLQYAGSPQTDAAGDDNAHFSAAMNRPVFSLGTLAGGSSRVLSYAVTVDSPLSNGATTISSTATATATNAATKQASASITASAAPLLTLVKSAPSSVAFPLTTLSASASAVTTITVADAAAIGAGDVISVGGTTATVTNVTGTTVTLDSAVTATSGSSVVPTWEYRLDYANTGAAGASSVVVSDVLPAGLTFISADSGGVNTSGTVTWNLGAVATGVSGSLRVRVRPDSATTYANSATLASAELSTVTSNITNTSTGSLTVQKTTSTPSGAPSGTATTATYVITLSNQSPSMAATGITVRDDLSAGFTYAGTTSIVGATAATSPVVGDASPQWTGLSIPANGSATITFTAHVSNVSPGTYQNYLAVTSGNANVLGFDALATTAEDVVIAAALGTTGVVSITSPIAPGGSLTIGVTDPDLNGNPAAAETVQVTVVNQRTGESETVTLTETGVSTGVFSGTLATSASAAAGTSNAAPLNVAGGDTVRASYSDPLTSTGGVATVTADSSVVAANSAPVVTMTASALAFTEGNSATAIDTGLTVSDSDSANLAGATVSISANYVSGEDVLGFTTQNGITGSFNATSGVLTLTGSATVANYQTALRSVTYANSSTTPSTTARTIAVVANDGTANSNTATRSLTVAAVNNAPVVTMTAGALAFTEGNSATAVDTGLTVTDADSTSLASATVTISANYSSGEDVLGFTTQNGITGSFNATSGVLTLTGSATVANYQTALRSVTYANNNTNPSTTARTIAVVANDGTANSNTATRSLTVAAVNNAPVVTMTASALAFTEGNSATAVDTGLTVTDADSTSLASATVTISANYSSGEDVLGFTTQNGITGSFNATSGVLTLTGSATVADYQSALRSVTYANSNTNPSTTARTIAVVVNDGTANSNTATRSVTVAAVNNAPAVTMTAAPLAYTGGTAPVAVDAGLGVTDVDSPALVRATMTIAGNYAPGEDVLAFASQNGISGSFDATTGVLTLTGSATLAQYRTALRTVTYENAAANPSTLTRTIAVIASDGLADSAPATRQITVAAPTQPALDQPADMTVTEDSGQTTVTLTGIAAGISGGALAVTAQAVNASLGSVGVTYQDPDGTAMLAFTPAPDAFGTTDVTVTVTAGGAGSGRTLTRTFRITVTPVNDRPTLDAPADRTSPVGLAQSVSLSGIGTGAANEAQPLTITVTSSNPAVVPPPTVTYTTPSAAGTLEYNPIAAGTATITVTIGDGETLNASLTRTFVVTAVALLNTPPTITPISDVAAIEGTPVPGVPFTIGDAETVASNLTVTVRSLNGTLMPAGGLTITGVGAARVLTLATAPNKIGTAQIVLTVSDGELSTSTTFTLVVSPLWNYYLPDGWASAAATTDIRATNPHTVTAPIRVTFVKDSGAPVHQFFDIAPGARWSLRLADVPAAGGAGVSTFIRSIDRLPLLVGRTMTWDGDAHAGSSETALESTNLQWYFAEGAQTSLRTSLILANPNDVDAIVTVTFLFEDGSAPVMRTYTVGALARRTVEFFNVPQLAGRTFGMVVDASAPIAAERTMYLDTPAPRQGGHSSVGVPFPSSQWYFAEGSNWVIFQTYMLLANPGTAPANVRVAYHTMTGTHFETRHVVPGRGRLTVDTLKEEPRLAGQHFWMSVMADQPIMAERSMYWDRGTAALSEGHNSHGVIAPARRWSTGDARVGGPQQYSTFVLIGNPSPTTATLTVTIKRDHGPDIVSTRQVGPLGRDTINVKTAVQELNDESFWLLIESDVPIVAERSQYWNPNGRSWSGGTNEFALPVVPADYNGCAYAVGPQALTAPAEGTSLLVSVGTTSRCTFRAEPQSRWLRVDAGASGSGVATVVIRVERNITTRARTGLVTIAGQTIAIEQAAGSLPARADFDGDGRTDVAVWRPSTGTFFSLTSNSGFTFGLSREWGVSAAGDKPFTGDLDGDGMVDLIVWRPGDGTWYWLTSGTGYDPSRAGSLQWGIASQGDIPILADFDGDGRQDFAVYRNNTGEWYWLTSSTNYTRSAFRTIQWGVPSLGDIPMVADFDGDGRQDLTVWRGSTGEWFWLTSSTNYTRSAFHTARWGVPSEGDKPFTGDFDGDGKSELIVYRPSIGTWFWLTSSSGYFNSAGAVGQVQWGINSQGDVPTIGDFDGDGRADIAVWRPGSGSWLWLTSSSGLNRAAMGSVTFGASTDIPMVK